MKKLLVLGAIVLVSVVKLSAQEQAAKVNPLGILFGVANAGFEFSTNETQSLTISALYYDIAGASGIGAGAEYRFYFSSGEALRGWHAGPGVGYLSLGDGFDNNAGFFNVGGEVGHQWIFGEHFLVDVFATASFVTGGSDDLLVSVDGLVVGLGASIGYAW